MISAPTFTVGIEEEYLVVDRTTRDLIREAPPGMLDACREVVGDQVAPEFLQSQIEIGSRVCTTMAEARSELARLRGCISSVVAEHGFAIIASSTHPFSRWSEQRHTDKERYNELERDLQAVVRRLLIGGMHVHVGIEDEDLRIDLMAQATYALPHLLALTTSSPFWEGRDTGLKSYRMSVWNELPRTGLPERFASFAEYRRHIDILIGAGIIEDATKVWWDLRPSARFPTLEMRIADLCTRLDDAVCVAALYRCWLRMLFRLRRSNQRWREYATFLIRENRWRAQRYGIEEGLLDFGRGEIVPFAVLVEEMIELLRPDAEHFGCVAEIEHAHTIVERGTSAHQQLAVYERARAGGADDTEALRSVVDDLIEQTMLGVAG